MSDPNDLVADRNTQLPVDLTNGDESKKRLTLADTLQIGMHLEYLRGSADQSEIDSGQILSVVKSIHRLLAKRKINSDVVDQIENYRSYLEEFSENSLSNDELDRLERKSITWMHLLNQELRREKRIPVSDTGLLDVDSLVDTPQDLVSAPVWDWLDERPREDLQEACKTIVIGCSTSSVMLSLRAVEHCLRKWYEQENDQLEAAWGRVLDQLMERYAEDDKKNDTVLTQLSDLPPVLSNLYYLKEKRNEVNHPEKSPDPQEARRTLMIVASTISEIFNEVREEAASEVASSRKQGTNWDTEDEITDSGLSDHNGAIMRGIQVMDLNLTDEAVPRSAILDLGEQIGLEREETSRVVQDLLMAGKIYEPSDDMFKPI